MLSQVDMLPELLILFRVSISVLEAVVGSGFLSQPTLSTVHRVLLSILLSLTQQNPQTFSKDLGAYETFQHKVFDLSARIAQHGNDGFAARSLGTVLSATATLSEGFRTQKVTFSTTVT